MEVRVEQKYGMALLGFRTFLADKSRCIIRRAAFIRGGRLCRPHATLCKIEHFRLGEEGLWRVR